MSNFQKIQKNIGRVALVSGFLFFFFAPMTSVVAQSVTETGKMFGISYTCTGTATDADGNTHPTSDCETFGSLIAAIQGITNFAVVNIALPFSIIVIIYAGWIYLTSGGEPDKRAKANKMFVKVFWGIFLGSRRVAGHQSDHDNSDQHQFDQHHRFKFVIFKQF